MNDKKAIIDASSAILIYKAGLFDLVRSAYRLVIAESVKDELVMPGHQGSEYFADLCKSGHMDIFPADSRFIENLNGLNNLGMGERDCILLYYGGKGNFIVLDDRKGARQCRAERIPYINALLLSRILWESGAIKDEEYRDAFKKLREIGRYTKEIIAYAGECERSGIEQFFP